jgi:hypothetical protein
MKKLQLDALKHALYAKSFINTRQGGPAGLATFDEVADFPGQGRFGDQIDEARLGARGRPGRPPVRVTAWSRRISFSGQGRTSSNTSARSRRPPPASAP